jgi:HlyD family secretion protein
MDDGQPWSPASDGGRGRQDADPSTLCRFQSTGRTAVADHAGPGRCRAAGGTLLATIEPNEPEILDDRALAQAEARVRAAEAVWNRVEPAVERARIEWEHAEAEWTRFLKLAETASVPAQQVDEAEMIYRARQQDLRSAQLAQDIARFEWDLAKAALLRATPSEVDSPTPRRFDIHSPIDGWVLRVLERSETVVQSGTPLLELGDVQDLEVEVDVLSADAVKISPGTRAFLERWGGDRPLDATVRLVEPAAFTKISALGVEEQRVNVILDLQEPPDQRAQLGDAFRVEARIVIWEAEDVLQVPTGALFRQRNDWAVFLIEENRAVLRIVEVGRRNSLSAQILAGLEEGDRVIMHPSVDGGRRTVARTRNSAYNEILVTEDEQGLRVLRFEPRGARQTVVKPGDPEHLEIPYAR